MRTVEERQKFIYISICCDASDFFGQSWTPLTCRIYNIAPEKRNRKELMFLMGALPGKLQKRGKKDYRDKVESQHFFKALMDFVMAAWAPYFNQTFQVHTPYYV